MKRSLCYLCLLLLAVVGCGPSLDRETKAYNHHMVSKKEYQERYSGLKPYLEAERKKASEQWKKAEAITDEKERLVAYQAVNESFELLTGGLLRIDNELDSMERQLRKLKRMKGNILSGGKRKKLWSEYEKLVKDVEADLSKKKPKNEGEAMALVGAQYGELMPLSGEINRAVTEANRHNK